MGDDPLERVAAVALLGKKGYNQRPSWLANAHADLD